MSYWKSVASRPIRTPRVCFDRYFFGFGYWHKKIQPLADQMAVTQLELARLQLLSLKADLKARGVEVHTP